MFLEPTIAALTALARNSKVCEGVNMDRNGHEYVTLSWDFVGRCCIGALKSGIWNMNGLGVIMRSGMPATILTLR